MPAKSKVKKADLNPVFEQNRIAQAIVKGHTVERRMDYGRIVVDGRTIGQVAARKSYVILECLHADTKVPAALEPAGKDGAARGDIAKLLAILIAWDRSLQDAVADLDTVGFGPTRVSELLGTSPGYAKVAADRARKKRARPKE